MKKLWLFLVVFFSFICSSGATSINHKGTGYYFKIGGEVKEVEKYFVKGREHMTLFKENPDAASHTDYTYSNASFKSGNDLIDIIYFGYNLNKNEENYYYTQMYLWKKYFNLEVTMCDEEGLLLANEEEIYQNIANMVNNHKTLEDFFTSPLRAEIWTSTDLNFNNNVDMQIPNIELNVKKNSNKGITIYNAKVGNYNFELKSTTQPLISRYYKESEYYYMCNQGPTRKSGNVSYEIYGTPFKIEEEIIGINGKMGDIKDLNNTYDLYLNDEYKYSIASHQEDYLKSQENYVLRNGFNPYLEPLEDLAFNVGRIDNYVLKVKRYVKGQKINLNILDNNTYYIYLKSNDELYYVVNKDVKEVLLPYGEYYLKDIKGDYNIPLIANLKDDVNLEINNPVKKEVKSSSSYETLKEEVQEEAKEEIKEEVQEVINNKVNNENINPQTLDNISIYLLTFILSLSSIIGHLILCKHMSNRVNLTK